MSESDKAVWAWAKLGRARELRYDLEGRIAAWSGASALGTEAVIGEDRLSFEVRLRMQLAPPLSEWTLILGDALHNLRAALDVLVWSFAEPDAMNVSQQKGVGWPIVTDSDKWTEAAASKLRSVPSHVVEQIKLVQPFNGEAADRERDGLLLLHNLDIMDKHRLTVTASARLNEMQVQHSVEFYDEAAAGRNVPPNVTFTADAPLEDGSLLLRGETVDSIEGIKGGFQLTYIVGVLTDLTFIGVLALLDMLIEQVRQTITFVTAAHSGTR